AAAQVTNGRPAQAPADEDHAGRQQAEQQHGPTRVIVFLEKERGAHDQQDQQGGALDDADDLFAEAAQAVDGVLPGQLVRHGGQQDNQREDAPAHRDVGGNLVDLEPAGIDPQVVGTYPGDGGQPQVGDQETDGQ